jgi:hypothetical protein
MRRAFGSITLLLTAITCGFAGLDDLEDINFPLNSSVVVDDFQGLELLASVMAKHSNLDLVVTGHTDALGTAAYNDRLSMRRAESVKAYLISKGAKESQVSTRGDGIARNNDNATREGRFQNRRVSLELYETVDGNRSKVSYRRLLELFFGESGDEMVGMKPEAHQEVMQKLSDLDKQMTALENRLSDALTGIESAMNNEEAAKQKMAGGYLPLGGYNGVSFGLGVDDDGDFAANLRGLYFRQVSDIFAIQTQGEFSYYSDWEEGQVDAAFIYQENRFKMAAAGSYKWAQFGVDGFDSARMAQGSLIADYLFDSGKIGVFGTIPILDGDVIAETTGISSAFVTETYIEVPRQFGLDFGVNIGQRAKLGGFVSSIDTEDADADLGAGLQLDVLIKDHLAWYVDIDMNQSAIAPVDDHIRYLTGLKFGSWNQARYGLTDDITPVEIPRIAYEIKTRTVRRGNNAPVAIAGDSRSNVPAGTVTLDGSASYDPDGDALTYRWTQIEGEQVALSDSTTAVTSFTGVAGETYSFELRATDSFGESSTSIVRIGMEAEAIPAPTVSFFTASPSVIDLGQLASLSWATTDADTVAISGVGAVGQDGSIIVSPEETTEYTLTVTNVTGSATQSVTITVREPEPVPAPEISFFNATPAEIENGEFTTLNWSTKFADSVTISGLGEVNPAGSLILSPEDTTSYTITATNETGQATADVTVTVVQVDPNIAPIADAGRDQNISSNLVPRTVTLDGSGSFDPDGDDITYTWVQTSGPPVVLSGADTATPSFTVEYGNYTFKLVVTDEGGLSDSDEVRVFVLNFKSGN